MATDRSNPPDLTFLAPSLAGNSVYTPMMFAGALERYGNLSSTIIGPPTAEVWKPVEQLSVPVKQWQHYGRGFPVSPGVGELRRSPFIYAFKPFPNTFGAALRARAQFGAQVGLHLDDWDSGYLADHPLHRRLRFIGQSVAQPGESLLGARVLEHLTGRADLLTVSSAQLQERFGGHLVRQGVDTNVFDPRQFPRDEARTKCGLPHDRPSLLFLGTPSLHKGIAELAMAVHELRTRDPLLVVVGEPRDAASRAALSLAGDHQLSLRPPVSMEEAAWYVAACDVFVVPQKTTVYGSYQTPAKLLFAMALGACIVASSVGDLPDLLEQGDAGALVPPDDPHELAAVLASLLDDATRRESLRSASRGAALATGWEAMAGALRPHLHRACAELS